MYDNLRIKITDDKVIVTADHTEFGADRPGASSVNLNLGLQVQQMDGTDLQKQKITIILNNKIFVYYNQMKYLMIFLIKKNIESPSFN